MMRKGIVSSAAILASGFVGAHLLAQSPPPGATLPPGAGPPANAPRMMASKDAKAAPAGLYKIDHEHSSVNARVPHGGFSYNVVRFAASSGQLTWDPENPQAIKLDVTVDTKPYTGPIVYKIDIAAPAMLDVAAFPKARFVSNSVRLTGGNKADVVGQLTLWGETRPAVIHAELIGAGQGMSGTVAGFTGTLDIDTAQFKKNPGPMSIGKVQIELDAEFIKS